MGRRRAKSVTGPKGVSVVERHESYNTEIQIRRYIGIEQRGEGEPSGEKEENRQDRTGHDGDKRVPWMRKPLLVRRGSWMVTLECGQPTGGRFNKREERWEAATAGNSGSP